MKLTRTMLLATGLSMTFGALPLRAPQAAEPVRLRLTLREHRFIPRQLTAPAGRPIEITLENTDGTREEFTSRLLETQTEIGGGATVVIKLLPLTPGQYVFFGSYNEATARGALIVTDAP